ncbi:MULTISPECIES: hypothetical protein [Geobacter]|uniref:Uncharacterized protein n=2 Tax=Geobacter TaxID=28231 RepID=A0A0C1TUS9_9BACT|nr:MULTISPECIES: hypothetical protein [Geobacter]ANA41053.1 hypothetical protein A2G06_13145 [Geobacter anodireducens]KIE43168.1 hypothetical protein SE37_11255 [Geobacter soli]MBE2888186.1 hypothetical protein [Geobacter anodireducens]HMN03929.1 hypothetical protein [Geobacter anodireducens]
MKKHIATALTLTLFTVMPALAVEHGAVHKTMDEQCIKECEMLVRNCARETDSLQQKIARLRAEIGKGTAVYGADELNRLDKKLKEANLILKNLMENR